MSVQTYIKDNQAALCALLQGTRQDSYCQPTRRKLCRNCWTTGREVSGIGNADTDCRGSHGAC